MPGLAANRLAKARRYADFLEARGVADQAADYSPAEWTEVAAQAGEDPPSVETVEMIVEVVADRKATRDRALQDLYRSLEDRAGGEVVQIGGAKVVPLRRPSS